MAASAIEFTNAGGMYEYAFTSAGAVAVQMHTKTAGRIYVFATLDDAVGKSLVGELINPYGNCLFGIDLPKGAKVTIRTEVEVINAMIENETD